jgi:hypothetical protein
MRTLKGRQRQLPRLFFQPVGSRSGSCSKNSTSRALSTVQRSWQRQRQRAVGRLTDNDMARAERAHLSAAHQPPLDLAADANKLVHRAVTCLANRRADVRLGRDVHASRGCLDLDAAAAGLDGSRSRI